MTPLIEAKECSFALRGATLVEDASVALVPGRLTVIIGPNGAGKSTLLKLLSGEHRPTRGTVLSKGGSLGDIPVWQLAARRAVMAQSSRITFPFAVHEVVRLGLVGVGRAQPRAIGEAMIEEALASADMLAFAGRDFQTLSGGEQQRVHFARTLVQLAAGASVEPVQALLLDEPIASLDLCHQIGLLEALSKKVRAQGLAALAVLHDLNLAAHFADHLVVMKGGRIMAAGAPGAIMTPTLLEEAFGVIMRAPAALACHGPFVLPQFCARAAQPCGGPSRIRA